MVSEVLVHHQLAFAFGLVGDAHHGGMCAGGSCSPHGGQEAKTKETAIP